MDAHDASSRPPSPDTESAGYLHQLKSRRVVRSAALYAAGAFIVLQVADLVVPALPFLPTWTYTAVVVLALVGFPFAMVFSWVYDVTSRGLVRTDAPGRSRFDLGRAATFGLGATLSILVSAVVTSRIEPAAAVAAPEFVVDVDVTPDEGELWDHWVAVAPFVDQTGDPELHQIGFIAGQWVEEGIHITGALTVVSIDEPTLEAGREETGLEGRAERLVRLAEQRGARYAVTGSYTALGDELTVSASVYDVADGSVAHTTSARAPVGEPRLALDAIQQDAMTFLHAAADTALYTLDPGHMPSYEAYQEFAAGVDAWFRAWRGEGGQQESVDHFRAAYEADPRLHFAAGLGLLSWNTFPGALDPTRPANRAYFRRAVDSAEPATEYGRASQAFFSGMGYGWNVPRRFWGAMRMFELMPEEKLVVGATISAYRFNRPARALEIQEWGRRNFGGSGSVEAAMLHMMGRYDEALERLRPDDGHSGRVLAAEMSSLAALGRVDEVMAKVPRLREISSDPWSRWGSLDQVAQELFAHGSPDAARRVWAEIVDQADVDHPRYPLQRATVLLHLDRDVEALPIIEAALAEEVVARDPVDQAESERYQLAEWGFLQAIVELRRGNEAWGEAWAAQVEAPVEPGDFVIWQTLARFETQRGDARAAMRYLHRPGNNFGFSPATHADPWLVPLHDDLDYQAWIRPRG